MKNIGARMKTLRNDMNLTPQAVSSYLDIPTEDLLDMENGNKNITLSIKQAMLSVRMQRKPSALQEWRI